MAELLTGGAGNIDYIQDGDFKYSKENLQEYLHNVMLYNIKPANPHAGYVGTGADINGFTTVNPLNTNQIIKFSCDTVLGTSWNGILEGGVYKIPVNFEILSNNASRSVIASFTHYFPLPHASGDAANDPTSSAINKSGIRFHTVVKESSIYILMDVRKNNNLGASVARDISLHEYDIASRAMVNSALSAVPSFALDSSGSRAASGTTLFRESSSLYFSNPLFDPVTDSFYLTLDEYVTTDSYTANVIRYNLSNRNITFEGSVGLEHTGSSSLKLSNMLLPDYIVNDADVMVNYRTGDISTSLAKTNLFGYSSRTGNIYYTKITYNSISKSIGSFDLDSLLAYSRAVVRESGI